MLKTFIEGVESSLQSFCKYKQKEEIGYICKTSIRRVVSFAQLNSIRY